MTKSNKRNVTSAVAITLEISPLSVFNDPFLAAFHGLNHERDIKNSTKPKTRPPPSPKQMRKINANQQVCSPSKRNLRATFDCI